MRPTNSWLQMDNIHMCYMPIRPLHVREEYPGYIFVTCDREFQIPPALCKDTPDGLIILANSKRSKHASSSKRPQPQAPTAFRSEQKSLESGSVTPARIVSSRRSWPNCCPVGSSTSNSPSVYTITASPSVTRTSHGLCYLNRFASRSIHLASGFSEILSNACLSGRISRFRTVDSGQFGSSIEILKG